MLDEWIFMEISAVSKASIFDGKSQFVCETNWRFVFKLIYHLMSHALDIQYVDCHSAKTMGLDVVGDM